MAFRKSWARLIQKIYEADPLVCPKCQGSMRIISFIEDPWWSGISSILWAYGWQGQDRPQKRTLDGDMMPHRVPMNAPLAIFSFKHTLISSTLLQSHRQPLFFDVKYPCKISLDKQKQPPYTLTTKKKVLINSI
jgi:hypothetical protein